MLRNGNEKEVNRAVKGDRDAHVGKHHGWEWDLNSLKMADPAQKDVVNHIKSAEVSRIDLIIRWGGRRRLSGFLPVQSIYADFYVLDDYWPDFKPDHFFQALNWYQEQDVTLGG